VTNSLDRRSIEFIDAMNILAPRGNIIALLGLPRGSVISLDGQTVALKRDDFVGFSNVPASDSCHFVTIRATSKTSTTSDFPAQLAAAVTVAYMTWDNDLIRKFDPQTEEMSSVPVDTCTTDNLLHRIETQHIDGQSLIPYPQLLNDEKEKDWVLLTNHVSKRLLQKRHIGTNDKIVPGLWDEQENEAIDGTPIHYPIIPILAPHASRHAATKRYLANLSPSARTKLYTHESPSDSIFERVLLEKYDNDSGLLLGDIQLAYVVFLHLHCFVSFEHWRDMIVMLSLLSEKVFATDRMKHFPNKLIQVLKSQLMVIGEDLFENSDLFDDNDLSPAMQRLIATLMKVVKDGEGQALLSRLWAMLRTRFPMFKDNEFHLSSNYSSGTNNEETEESDEDRPVLVASEEVQASLARSQGARLSTGIAFEPVFMKTELQEAYPLLLAAVMPHEDILMTCARALDEATDVSLVREAAAYLEQVELQRHTTR
jgi:hypothetical protein